MEDDVLHHGDLVEFRSRLKCEACQRGDHTCIIQENTSRCISCDGAGVECIFARTVTLRGPKHRFQWEWLLNEVPTRSVEEGLEMSKTRISGESPRPLRPRHTPSDLRKLWRKAVLVCRVISRFRAVNRYKKNAINEASNHDSIATQDSISEQHLPAIFAFSGGSKPPELWPQIGGNAPDHRVLLPDSAYGLKVKEVDHARSPFAVFQIESMEKATPRRRRQLSPRGKAWATQIRLRGGVCAPCRAAKRKCRHVLDVDPDANSARKFPESTIPEETTRSPQELGDSSIAKAQQSPLLTDSHILPQHATTHPPNLDYRLEPPVSIYQTPESIQDAAPPSYYLPDYAGPQPEQNDTLIMSSEGMIRDSEKISPFPKDSHKPNPQSTTKSKLRSNAMQCPVCQIVLYGPYARSNLTRHIRERHCVQTVHKCPVPTCGKTFNRSNNLQVHRRTVHGAVT